MLNSGAWMGAELVFSWHLFGLRGIGQSTTDNTRSKKSPGFVPFVCEDCRSDRHSAHQSSVERQRGLRICETPQRTCAADGARSCVTITLATGAPMPAPPPPQKKMPFRITDDPEGRGSEVASDVFAGFALRVAISAPAATQPRGQGDQERGDPLGLRDTRYRD